MEKPDEALAMAREGVESASKAGAIDMALDLLLKMVVIEEGRGNLEEAQKLLNEATAVSAHTSDELKRLRVKITCIRLQRQLNPPARDERALLKQEALQMLSSDTLRKLRDFPVLLREVAAELSKQSPQIAAAALQTLGVEVITDAQAEALGRAVANKVVRSAIKQFSPENTKDVGKIRKWAVEKLTTRETRKLSSALASSKAGSAVLGDFRNYFRAGVSSALKGKL